MNIYKSIKDIPNPYQPYNPIRSEKFFIGRQNEIRKILSAIDDFLKTNVKKDFLIYGEKAIGKTSFLNIISEKILQKGLLVIKLDLTPNKVRDDLTFFKEIFDCIMDSTKDSDLFCKEENEKYSQREIWESLTIRGEHDSTRLERKIHFAEVYADYLLRNKNRTVPLSIIKNDLIYILNEIKKEFKGLVLILDEFHILKEQVDIVYNIQGLMEYFSNIIFIFCGNELITSDAFEKIRRTTEIIQLKPFDTYEIYDFIYKPIMNYGFLKNEIENELDFNVIRDLLDVVNFNPYFINLLLHNMFEFYKNNITEKITINEQILNILIDQLKVNSTLNERITAQLNASSDKQIEALTKLLPFQGLNLYDIALILHSFNKIEEESIQDKIKLLVDYLIIIKPLNLFKVYPHDLDLKELTNKNINLNEAAEIKYEFYGDNLDEIYLMFYIKKSLDKRIFINKELSTIDILSFKLQEFFIEKLTDLLDVNKEKEIKIPVAVKKIEKIEEDDLSSNKIQEKIRTLYDKAEYAEKNKLNENDFKDIQKALNNLALRNLLFISILGLEETCFYYVFIKVKIRYKIFVYEYFINSKNKLTEDFVLYISEKLIDQNLEQYNIHILDSVVLPILPKIIGFVTYIDTNEMYANLIRKVIVGDYNSALKIVELLRNILYDEDTYNNNVGFLNICSDNLEIAKRYLENVKEPFIITNCNLGYYYYRQSDYSKSDLFYKRAEKNFKKLKTSVNDRFLIIHQILLPIEKRKNLPTEFDLVLEPSEELIIRGNRAILASFNKQNYGFSLIKNINVDSELNQFYKDRFIYYLHFNLGNLQEARKLFNQTEERFKSLNVINIIDKYLEFDREVIFENC